MTYWMRVSVIWLMLGAGIAHADQAPLVAVRNATDTILTLTLEAKDKADNERQGYYDKVSAVLDDVIDFPGFARGVMATYASSRQYNQLNSDAERAAFNQRIERFGDKLKGILIVTYADALLAFNGEKINVFIPPGGEPDNHRATVYQEIYSSTGKTYLVQYAMREQKSGGWKVFNMTVDGANLGQIYRNQFAAAVEAAKGDVNKAVDDWGKQP